MKLPKFWWAQQKGSLGHKGRETQTAASGPFLGGERGWGRAQELSHSQEGSRRNKAAVLKVCRRGEVNAEI